MKIHGIIPAMVTPFNRSNWELNEGALRKLTRFLIDGGVHGLFAVGSQGEFWTMTAEEKRRVWEVVLEETDGQIPVCAGTGAITTGEAIRLTRLAEEVGVHAVSVLSPFFVSPTEEELYTHYREIAEATKLPVLLYGNPARTGVTLTGSLVSRLSRIDNIVGIKDSSGDLQLTMEYLRLASDDFFVVMGRDTLIFAALMAGAQGSIAATANVVPALVVQIYERLQTGDIEGAKEAQQRLFPLRSAFSWGTFPVVIKEALDIMGIEAGPTRGPVGPMAPDQRKRLEGLLKDMKVI